MATWNVVRFFSSARVPKISRPMKAYIERSQEHERFMRTEIQDFESGRLHLANMMGKHMSNSTQSDIDSAIQYLFPSGLFDPRARPLMRHPQEVFPGRKAAEFDEMGRPFHTMFYTGKPNFFKLLYDIVEEIEQMSASSISEEKTGENKETSGTQWITKDSLEVLLMEKLIDLEYKNFVDAMSKLSSFPTSDRLTNFIKKYQQPLLGPINSKEYTKRVDMNGLVTVTTSECLRKRARAEVSVHFPGTGKIEINGQNMTYFKNVQQKEQVLFPLKFTNMIGKVDVTAAVEGGGPSGQAGAIRWGIAKSLCMLKDESMVEKMRLAGLLTRDFRQRERKKPGQEGARRKFTWKKR